MITDSPVTDVQEHGTDADDEASPGLSLYQVVATLQLLLAARRQARLERANYTRIATAA